MALDSRMLALATAIGNDVKSLTGMLGDVTLLETVNKTELVAAINELVLNIQAINEHAADQYDRFNDLIVTTENIFSSDKLVSLLATYKDDIINGAPEAYDTLSEIAAYLANNDINTQNVINLLVGAVAVAPQTLTEEQQIQAQQNIDVLAPADPGANIREAYIIASDNNTYMQPGYVMPGYVA